MDDTSAGPLGVPGYGRVEALLPRCPNPGGLWGVLDLTDEDGVGTPASFGVPIPDGCIAPELPVPGVPDGLYGVRDLPEEGVG